MREIRAACTLLAFVFVGWSSPLSELSGLITDPQGNAVPLAAVTILCPATGAKRVLSSTSDGLWSAPVLPPGAFAKVDRNGWISDEAALSQIVTRVMAENPEQVAAYRAGKTQLHGWFMGQVMRATGGQADPTLANKLLSQHLPAPDRLAS